MDLFVTKKNCCGCSACENICPKKSISMIADNKGFLYPTINLETCIKCNLCKKVCPFNNDYIKVQNIDDIKVYAAKNIDEDVRRTSSSGGVFTVISDFILKNNGSIYGAEINENFDVNHNRAITAKERDKFKGSKYVQSNLKDIFMKVKQDIKEGKYVLFTGTPCQVAGLNMFLGEKIDKNKLYLCDIICHGTPSPKLFKDYISFMEKKHKSKIKHINFRSKSIKNELTDMKIVFTNGKVYNKPSWKEPFYRLFYSDMIIRPSCYNCKFSNLHRASDITIGDYWGIDKSMPDFQDNKGISLILINSEKGQDLFESIKENMIIRNSNIVDCLQPNLQQPTKENSKTEVFWKDYDKRGFRYIIKKYADYGIFREILRKVKGKIKRILNTFHR